MDAAREPTNSQRPSEGGAADDLPTIAPRAALHAPALPHVEGYELLEEIGRGGMGVVYKARQLAAGGRTVALKVMLGEPFATPAQLKRFEREVAVAAELKHPNIAGVHDSGLTRGRHFYAMEYVEGARLDEYCAGRRMSLEDRLRLFWTICEAVAHAHRRGVVHRDLKPANILVDAEGRPYVLDFGLARYLEAAAGDAELRSRLTLTGAVMGTLPYMAPEQAREAAGEIDARTDVYALGVILYEMLTGRYPYEVTGQMADVLRNIAEAEPRRPSSLNPEIARELEIVILRALAKAPGRRYATAWELARDVAHYLADEPIETSVGGVGYRLRRFAWRCRAAAVAIARAFGRSKSEHQTVFEAKSLEAEARHQLERENYVLRISLADSGLKAHDFLKAEELLDQCPAVFRHWEWYRLKHLCHPELATLAGPVRGPLKGLFSVCYSPDGTRLAAGSETGEIVIWDARTLREVMTLKGHTGWACSVAFSPDGRRLVSGGRDETVRLWDACSGEVLLRLSGAPGEVGSVAFSPDGTRIASSHYLGRTFRIWDVSASGEGREVATLRYGNACFYAAAFSPDGTLIAAGYALAGGGQVPVGAGGVALWDTGTWKLVKALGEDAVRCAVFSPDGRTIAAAEHYNRGTIRIWEVQTGACLTTLTGHTGELWLIAFSPDGKRLSSTGNDRTVRVWDIESGRELCTLRGHSHWTTAAAWSPDGTRVASSSCDGTIKLWDTEARPTDVVYTCDYPIVDSVAVSPNGKVVASASRDGVINTWDIDTGRTLATVRPETRERGASQPVAFSPDGRLLATAYFGGTIRLWEPETARVLGELTGHGDDVQCLAFSPDGKHLASAALDGTIAVWDTRTWSRLLSWVAHPPDGTASWWGVRGVDFAPDGARLASAGSTPGGVKLWDAQTGKEVLTVCPGGWESFPAFSPDGALLATSSGAEIHLWDPETGRRLGTLAGHSALILRIAFSPDGRRLASASNDQTVKLWDLQSGRELLTLEGHSALVVDVAFTPDGRRIVSCGLDHTARVWDAGPEFARRRGIGRH